MKIPPVFFAAIALLAAASMHLDAQEPSGFGLAPAKPESLLPGGQDIPLIPEGLPPLDKRDKAATPDAGVEKKEKKSATAEAEDALRSRIKLREAKTKAQREPDLVALWDQGARAKTDFEQRAIWKDYYIKLCERIAKIDPTIRKEDIDVLRGEYVGRFKQDRVEPTVDPAVARAKR